MLNHGPPKLIRQNMWPAERPFIVLSLKQTAGCPNAAQVDAFLSYAWRATRSTKNASV